MPQTAALLLFQLGAPLWVSNFLVTAAGSSLFWAAASFGINWAAGALLGGNRDTTTTQDVQTNIRQEISARRRIYGRQLLGSVVVFAARRGEKSYILHYIGEGPINAFVSFRLDKRPVTLDVDGYVTETQYVVGGRSRVQILTKLGTMTDEPFDELIAAFPELDHTVSSVIYGKPFRHRGCAMALQIVEQVPAENMVTTYPNNMPSLQMVIDGLDAIDPSDGSSGLSDNAGRVLLTEILDVYGLTYADTALVDFAAFADFADHCDDDIALAAGGTEKRYRATGVIEMSAGNEARISAIAAVCNADIFMDQQGRITVRQKLRQTPGIALRAKNGDHLSIDFTGGRALQKQFNTAIGSYVDPNLNYKANQVAWRQADWITEDGGELSEHIDLRMCPSPTQAQRLLKLAIYLGNPEYEGTLVSGPQALDLLEDECFTLDLSPEEDFERVASAAGDISVAGESVSVQTGFVIFADGATAWTSATDEQEQITEPPDLPANVDEVALTVTVAVGLLENSAPVLNFSWVPTTGNLPDSYLQQVQVSVIDANDWHDASVNQDADTAQYGPVADGGFYDWRIRNKASGVTFDWQVSPTWLTVTVDTTPPQDLLTASASGGAGQFTANFGTENDAHLETVAIYRVSSGGTLDRDTDLAARPSVAPGISYMVPVTSTAGNWDIYFEPMNISSVAGTLEGPFAVTVT